MLIENQKVEMKWRNANKAYYQNKGYTFTSNGDSFYVNIEDLPHSAGVKLKIKCDDCGEEYEMTCAGYFKGYEKSIQNNTPLIHFCNECKFKHMQESLYIRAMQACEKKGYVLLSDKSEILRNTSYVRYLCPMHGEHTMKVANLICGKGCPDCHSMNNSIRFKLSPDDVESRVQACGGTLLNKEDYINQYEQNLLIECMECKKPFKTSLVLFTQHGGQVCDDCNSTESIGEKRIRIYLEKNEILFAPQKWFPDCKDKRPLPFDFYLPDYNTIIEFDGRQHFGDTNYFTYSFEETKKHDEIKNNYCKANGIYLVRIPYWRVGKINEILDKELILHEDIV